MATTRLESDRLHAVAGKPGALVELKRMINEKHIHVDVLHSIYGTRAVDYAAQSGDLINVKYLIEEAGASLDASNKEENLLFWALLNSSQSIVDYVTNPLDQLEKRFNDGTNRLMMAIAGQRIEEIRTILDSNPEQLLMPKSGGQSALFFAGMVGNAVINQMLSPYLLGVPNLHEDPQYIRGQIYYCVGSSSDKNMRQSMQSDLKVINLLVKLRSITTLNSLENKLLNRTLEKIAGKYVVLGKLKQAQKCFLMQLDFLATADVPNKASYVQRAQAFLSSIHAEQRLMLVAEKCGLTQLAYDRGDSIVISVLRVIARQHGKEDLSNDDLLAMYSQLSNHFHLYHRYYAYEVRQHPEKYRPYIVNDKDELQGLIIFEALARTFNVTTVLFENKNAQAAVTVVKRESQKGIIYLSFAVETGFHLLQRKDGDHFLIDDAVAQAPVDRFSPVVSLMRDSSVFGRARPVPPLIEVEEGEEEKEQKNPQPQGLGR